MSINDTVVMDKNAPPVTDSVRVAYNLAVRDLIYFMLNRVVHAAAASMPVCATATTTSKVKTTNACTLVNAGAVNALAATDNFWTLTGGDLAVSSFRRYLLCADASDAASVIASTDAATAAACRFPNLPANGVAIVGVLTVATDATHTFTPGTTLLGAAGITATYIDGIDINVPLATLVAP
jgi:hypothetical protein